MAGFFDSLLGKKNEQDEHTTRILKEIESMEFKKQTLINSVRGEIKAAELQINQLFQQIGALMYESHIGTPAEESTLTDFYTQITQHKTLITEKEAKINDITARYEDEIGMLRASIGAVAAPAIPPGGTMPAAGGGAFCEQCGGAYTPGEDIFCPGCGNKLG